MTAERGEVSLLSVATVLMRHWQTLALLAGGSALAIATITFLQPRYYTSTAQVVAQSASIPSGVASLAAQFGVAVPGRDGSTSPSFYADLVESREVLAAVVDTAFELPTGDGVARVTLPELWHTAGATPELRRDAAIRRLGSLVSTTVNVRTGVVTVRARSRDAVLSRRIVERLIELLQRFNVQQRQSQASAERQFTEGRLNQSRIELRNAEDRLEAFLLRNRDLSSSRLQLERDRLQRNVEVRQQVFVSLATAFEQSRIEEVRDTPVLTVIEHAEAPVRGDSRGTVRNAILTLLLGGVLGLFVAFAREYLEQLRRTAPEELAAFSGARAKMQRELKHLVRRSSRREPPTT